MPLSHFQPDQYSSLLEQKIGELLPRFSALETPEATIFSSLPSGFRLRAEFRIWHSGDELDYVMFRKDDPKTPVIIDSFPIASNSIQQLMPRLLDQLRPVPALRRKLFQVEFLSTLAGDMLVTLIYHRPLDDAWQQAAQVLAEELGINLVGRSRKEKRVIGRDWVEETLNVHDQAYHYKQPEQAFTQPNGVVNQQMIGWAQDCARTCSGDLLELYCGVGNFTLPLAGCFDNVIATELSKPATAAAVENLAKNAIDNVEFARLSAEDMSDAMAGVRPFRRLARLKQPLAGYALNTLLVDPPRAGLDAQTLSLAKGFERIIYISCNPETLLANLEALAESHSIERLAFFDQFPYTHHMESGVLLQRRAV